MGGEGHIFDMIQRAKQNRKMIQDRRDRMKDLVEKMNEKPLTGYPNKLAEGEMEQIARDIKSREDDEKVYYTRFMFAFLGILLLVMLVVWGMWRMLGARKCYNYSERVVNLSLIPMRECWNTNYIRVK